MLLAVVATAGVGMVMLGQTEAVAQFWGWNRGGGGGGGGFFGNWGRRDNWRGDPDRWDNQRGFYGDWRRERDRDRDRNGDESRTRREAATSGASGAYCVRLCDGFYFPLSKSSTADAKTLCSGLCPATATDVYFARGGDDAMANARNQTGKAYTALPAAYAYRKALKPDCGCRSAEKPTLTAANDPTLRSGDIVVTRDGPRVFQGSSSARAPHSEREFVDYRQSRAVSGGLRAQLDAMTRRYYSTRAQATTKAKDGRAAEEPRTEGRSRGRHERRRER
jgi:hypothetical protein